MANQSRDERTEVLIQQRAAERKRKRTLIIAANVVLVIVIVGAGWFVLSKMDTSGDEARAPDASSDASSSGSGSEGAQSPDTATEAESKYGIKFGDDSAPNALVVYEDFQCPACKNFEAQAGDLIDQALEEGKITVEYRPMSFLDQASTNEYSSRAYNAALAVLDQAGPEAFKQMHALLFENQTPEGEAGLSDDELVDLAVEAGASESDVRPLIEEKAFAQWIKNATDQASKDGVTGTPTIWLNGEEPSQEELTNALQ